MANIDGGALTFKSVMENDQMNSAIEETLRRIQGLSDATVAGGKQMDKTFLQTVDGIRQAIGQIGAACEIHENELTKLKARYDQLGKEASTAFMAGRDAEYRAIEETRTSIQGEIAVRKDALSEARNLSDELEKEIAKRENNTKAIEANKNAHQSLRSRIRELKDEMAMLVDQGIDEQSEAYKALVNELGRLQDIQGDIAQQGKILANDEAKFQGIIQGLSGLAGAFSTATGTISLFAGENENLQKVMTKVQSVMAIATGMQSVAQTLNKDSAFQLVTLNGLKEWWAEIVAKATVAETAEAGATQLNTVAKEQNAAATGKASATETLDTAAKEANTAAATAGTTANFTLAGAFRAVGLAIKSVPVFGWIITAITALSAIVSYFSSKTKEAKETQAKLVEQNYKSIGSINELSEKWKRLGNDMEAKKRFIKENQKAFKELNLVINDTKDAQQALIDNKEEFIQAQIAKAQSLAILESPQYQEAMKKSLEARLAFKEATEEWNKTVGKRTGREASTMDKIEFKKKDGKISSIYAENANHDMVKAAQDAKEAEMEMQKLYAISEDLKLEHETKMAKLNKVAIEKNKHTVDGKKALLQSELEDLQKQRGMLLATDTKTIADYDKKIKAKQAEIDKLEPKPESKKTSTTKNDKDPFVEMLDKRKAEYERFYKWQNSSNEETRKAAKTEFANLIKDGSSYEEFLKRLHDKISALPQNDRTKNQLKAIRNELAEINKTTVLETFKESLQRELDGADNVLERLEIIEEKRKELAKDGTDVDNDKKQALDDAKKNALQKQKEETDKLLEEHASFLERKIKLDMQYNNDLALLEKARAEAPTDQDRQEVDTAISNRKKQHDKDSKSLGSAEYGQMLKDYQTLEQKKQEIIDEYNNKREIAAQALLILEREMMEAKTETEREEVQKRIDIHNAMLEQMDKSEKADLLKQNFEGLKATPEYIRAFEDLDFASTETLKNLVDRFEQVKNSVGENLNPEDVIQYAETIQKMVDEIISRDPFAALKQGYKELKTAGNELKNAQKELDEIRAKGGAGTDKEVKAIARVNKAKDQFNKKNKEVRKSEKEVSKQVGELCDGLKEVGKTIGGEAGNIISLIGDIGNFVLSSIDSVKMVATTGAQAISTVEKASVILTIISAALQIATKIFNLFAGDDGTAAYEAARKVYQAYIDTLYDVVDAELELMNTMSGKDAREKYETAISYIKKAENAARDLGKQYLDTGASKGFLGIGSKASHGVKQQKDISKKAWEEAFQVARDHDINWESISMGRMTGLFDLTVEQLKALKKDAPLFFAQLHEDTREYINNIIAADDKLAQSLEQFNETLTGISFDTMRDDFVSSLQDMELNAKTISNNIKDYMRKALINDMFKNKYKEELRKYYNTFANSMKEESDGGSSVSDKEQQALDSIRNSIVSGAVAAAEEINKQFQDLFSEDKSQSLAGAVSGVSEETAGIVAGYLNAVRINQVEATDILRQQLSTLNTIAYNTEYNKYLQSIDRRLSAIQNTNNALRSQGFS